VSTRVVLLHGQITGAAVVVAVAVAVVVVGITIIVIGIVVVVPSGSPCARPLPGTCAGRERRR
jgi:hypothetical protein